MSGPFSVAPSLGRLEPQAGSTISLISLPFQHVCTDCRVPALRDWPGGQAPSLDIKPTAATALCQDRQHHLQSIAASVSGAKGRRWPGKWPFPSPSPPAAVLSP